MNHGDAAEYLSTVFRPLLRVHSSTGIFADAFTLQSTAGFSWYDSILVASAMQAGCTQLFTEDLQHGQRFGSLRIVNPFLWPE
jgi:predicted nucleic acid-binding protein